MNLYSAFHDWRAHLLQDLQRVEMDTLRTLRGDMARTLEAIDREIARRAAAQQTTRGNDDNRTD